ncbi:single-stranded DNA-binding protein [Lentibacillus salinarum]|uniref:Single-stranded DNA-binding protein n=1 Tax=Lentibacillus salinarum TaxID=446820 RepID=A0ABW3ZXZ9_9BACI
MLNNCTFVGRLGKDVDLRYTQNGKAVANFSLALTRPVADKNGTRHADFIRCQAWGKTAENMADNLTKGDMIGIQSRVQTRTYQDQSGNNRFVTEFVVEGFPQFLKVKKWENGNGSNNGNQNRNAGQNNRQQNPFDNNEPIDISDDNLPF